MNGPDFTVIGNDESSARMQRAARIADRAAVTEIECECAAETIAGVKWYDTGPMLDPNEHAPQSIDIARELLDYAIERRLVIRHPHEAHLVRVAR